jgi:hypothetical protein
MYRTGSKIAWIPIERAGKIFKRKKVGPSVCLALVHELAAEPWSVDAREEQQIWMDNRPMD